MTWMREVTILHSGIYENLLNVLLSISSSFSSSGSALAPVAYGDEESVRGRERRNKTNIEQ